MPIDMPTMPGFTTSRFFLETNTQTFTSPLTKTVQRMTLPGSRWIATFSLPAMNRAQAGRWQGFLLELEGSSNTFNAYDPDKKTPRGAASGIPRVNGDAQTGTTLVIDGCTPDTVFLRAGDMFSVNGELAMATADIPVDGSGNATLVFRPALRSSPPDDAVIVTDRPTCTMVLQDDMQADWECDKNGIYQPKTFSAFEVFT